ncbi:T9SS type A sorting domain-containing protein, partial [Fluviicola sp.]|uniref:T9SS type A sorting domain-containing protein n=1 Tax=Fluviicola sp. TaxID=1917219 RepID=UPI002618B506
WDFTNSVSSDFLQVTVGWNDAAQSGLNDCGDISLTVWNGTQWSFVTSLTSGLCNGANEGTLFSTGNLPANGPVSIGFTSNVTQQYVTLCPGDSVNVGTNTYHQSGTYFDILQDVNGDDSTVVTVVNALNPLISGITNNVTSITVTAPTATGYQWIDCANGNSPIPGATNATFTPDSNGTYAVIVTNSFGCIDTSTCEIINQLGIDEWHTQTLRLFPNPLTNGDCLRVNSVLNNIVIESMDGKVIPAVSVFVSGSETWISLPVLSKGIYLLRSEDGKQSSRFAVN